MADAETKASEPPQPSTVTLSSGFEMPRIGLGTWKAGPGEVGKAVKLAIDAGYRHIDCAAYYGNEPEIGQALKEVFESGTVSREDIFITSKLWNTEHGQTRVKPALQKTLADLQLDYLDLYLIHWPMPEDESGAYTTVPLTETWGAMEACVGEGLVRSIGVSNFNRAQLEEVCASASIQPANQQIECHPYFAQAQMVDYCAARNMAVTGYRPLGPQKEGDDSLLRRPEVNAIAEAVGKSAGQVLLRFQLQRGLVTIPKSCNAGRIAANLDLLSWELSDAHMAALLALHTGERACRMDGYTQHPMYPFNGSEDGGDGKGGGEQ